MADKTTSTAAERRRALLLAKQGMSCRGIGKKLGRNPKTISVWLKGKHVFGEFNKTHAAALAQQAYSAESRSMRIAELAEQLKAMVARLDGPYIVSGFGGREYEYNEHQLDRPDGAAANNLASACYRIVATMKQLHDFDKRDGADLSDFDRFLAAMMPKDGK